VGEKRHFDAFGASSFRFSAALNDIQGKEKGSRGLQTLQI
jgi:hypothetical protein